MDKRINISYTSQTTLNTSNIFNIKPASVAVFYLATTISLKKIFKKGATFGCCCKCLITLTQGTYKQVISTCDTLIHFIQI